MDLVIKPFFVICLTYNLRGCGSQQTWKGPWNGLSHEKKKNFIDRNLYAFLPCTLPYRRKCNCGDKNIMDPQYIGRHNRGTLNRDPVVYI